VVSASEDRFWPLDVAVSKRREAQIKLCLGLEDVECRAEVRSLGGSKDTLQLSVTDLPNGSCKSALRGVEAACFQQDFAVLATDLEVQGDHTTLSFVVASSFGEPRKVYEDKGLGDSLHVEIDSAEDSLLLRFEGQAQAGLFPSILKAAQEHGHHVVRARVAAGSRAPNAIMSGECWLLRTSDAGDLASIVKSVQLACNVPEKALQRRVSTTSTASTASTLSKR